MQKIKIRTSLLTLASWLVVSAAVAAFAVDWQVAALLVVFTAALIE